MPARQAQLSKQTAGCHYDQEVICLVNQINLRLEAE